jgi:hypothetical protein
MKPRKDWRAQVQRGSIPRLFHSSPSLLYNAVDLYDTVFKHFLSNKNTFWLRWWLRWTATYARVHVLISTGVSETSPYPSDSHRWEFLRNRNLSENRNVSYRYRLGYHSNPIKSLIPDVLKYVATYRYIYVYEVYLMRWIAGFEKFRNRWW